jgi:hypothetical protein
MKLGSTAKPSLLAASVVASTALLAGCGGGSGNESPESAIQNPASVVFLSAPPASLAVNASATVSAAATYASPLNAGSTAVSWSVSCASANHCGTLTANNDAGALTYQAPAVIPAGSTVTLTATSVADPLIHNSATITIVAPIPITVAFAAPTPASLRVGASIGLSAVITNDVSSDPLVNWTAMCGAAACGSFSPASTASNVATSYTAPTAIPSGGQVTLTATSITDPTKSTSATVVIVSAPATLANGTYVYQMRGPQSATTGVLVASNGQITGGEQDSNEYESYVDGNGNTVLSTNPTFQAITGGSYTVTSDGNLSVTIQFGTFGAETLFGTLGGGTHGIVSGLNGVPVSGSLDLQASVGPPTGGYAMVLSGGDENEAPAWIGGIVNIDGPGSISGSGSVLDLIDSGGNEGSGYTLGPGTVSTPDSLGRLQLQLQTGTGPLLLPPLTLAAYIIDPTHLRLIEIDSSNTPNSFQGVLSGQALGQGGETGQFNAASLAGQSYVFGAQGNDASGALQLAGIITPDAGGGISGTLNWNDLSGKSAQSPLSVSGTWTVDATGRATLKQLTDGATFTYSAHLYLAAGGNALLLSADTADVFAGEAYSQQGGSLGAASLSGQYGLATSAVTPPGQFPSQQTVAMIGTVSATPAGGGGDVSLNGFSDPGNGGPDVAVTGSFSTAANGVRTGTFTGLEFGADAPARFTIYQISPMMAVAIETDPAQLTLGYLRSPQ